SRTVPGRARRPGRVAIPARDADAAPRAVPGGSLRGSCRLGGHGRRLAGELPELPLRGRLGPDERLVVLAADERLDAVERDVVVDLLRRALHEVARGRDERALQATIEAELEAADGVSDDARRVRGVPHLELELGVERDVA